MTWPWPADTLVERARRVAQIYRHLLHQVDPEACARLDRQMLDAGQTWLFPTPQTYQPDDLLTAELAADAVHVARRTIYYWRERGLPVIATPDGPRYRYDDVQQFAAQARRRRTRH